MHTLAEGLGRWGFLTEEPTPDRHCLRTGTRALAENTPAGRPTLGPDDRRRTQGRRKQDFEDDHANRECISPTAQSRRSALAEKMDEQNEQCSRRPPNHGTRRPPKKKKKSKSALGSRARQKPTARRAVNPQNTRISPTVKRINSKRCPLASLSLDCLPFRSPGEIPAFLPLSNESTRSAAHWHRSLFACHFGLQAI